MKFFKILLTTYQYHIVTEQMCLTRKVFLPVISNSFGKNTVNCIHFELIPVKNSAAKYL